MGSKVVEKEMRYVKKPIAVEAIQWTGHNFDQVCNFITNAPVVIMGHNDLVISTLEGDMHAPAGSYIIRGEPYHEYYPCRREVFEATYEPVEE